MKLAALALAIVATAPVQAAPKLVVAYGDSITLGNALPAADRPKVWVRRLEQLAPGRLIMANEGDGGRWTRSLDEFDAMLKRRPHADILVLALGTNDSLDVSEGMVPRASANLRDMIGHARRAWGAALQVLVVGPPQLRADRRPPGAATAARNARLRALNEAFAELAKRSGARFVGLYGVLPDASLAADGMHPDASGNEAIARALLPALLDAAGP